MSFYFLLDHPDVNMDSVNGERCGVNKPWSESRLSKNNDYSVISVTRIFDDDGKELKKTVKYWPRERKSINLKLSSGIC